MCNLSLQELPQSVGNLVKLKTFIMDENLLELLPDEVHIPIHNKGLVCMHTLPCMDTHDMYSVQT